VFLGSNRFATCTGHPYGVCRAPDAGVTINRPPPTGFRTKPSSGANRSHRKMWVMTRALACSKPGTLAAHLQHAYSTLGNQGTLGKSALGTLARLFSSLPARLHSSSSSIPFIGRVAVAVALCVLAIRHRRSAIRPPGRSYMLRLHFDF
jgi:hypothetical protein